MPNYRITHHDGYLVLELYNMDLLAHAWEMGQRLIELTYEHELEQLIVTLDYPYERSSANDRRKALYYATMMSPYRRFAFVTPDERLQSYLHTFVELMKHSGTFNPRRNSYAVVATLPEATRWIRAASS